MGVAASRAQRCTYGSGCLDTALQSTSGKSQVTSRKSQAARRKARKGLHSGRAVHASGISTSSAPPRAHMLEASPKKATAQGKPLQYSTLFCIVFTFEGSPAGGQPKEGDSEGPISGAALQEPRTAPGYSRARPRTTKSLLTHKQPWENRVRSCASAGSMNPGATSQNRGRPRPREAGKPAVHRPLPLGPPPLGLPPLPLLLGCHCTPPGRHCRC